MTKAEEILKEFGLDNKREGMETAFSAVDKVMRSHKFKNDIKDFFTPAEQQTLMDTLTDIIADENARNNLIDLLKKAGRAFDKEAPNERTP